VVEAVPFHSNGFLSVTELMAGAIGKGFVVRELPCTLHSRQHGASKARIARTVASHLKYQWHLVWSR
jgi:hypothetical protein